MNTSFAVGSVAALHIVGRGSSEFLARNANKTHFRLLEDTKSKKRIVIYELYRPDERFTPVKTARTNRALLAPPLEQAICRPRL